MTLGWVSVMSVGLLFPGGFPLFVVQFWMPPLGPGRSRTRLAHLAFAIASLVQRSRGRVGPDVVLLCVIP